MLFGELLLVVLRASTHLVRINYWRKSFDDQKEWGIVFCSRIQSLGSCHAPLHEECPQHHGHKGVPGVTLGTCGAIGERAQVFLVWVRTLSVENASHPRRLGVMSGKPQA